MNAIIDFFTSIIDIVLTWINYLINWFQSVIWLISAIPRMISGVTAGFSYSPTFILPFLTASVSILVVVFLIRLL